jgi:hypothetical protein
MNQSEIELTSWVILFPLHDNISWSIRILGWSYELNISLLGVVWIGYDTIPGTEPFS